MSIGILTLLSMMVLFIGYIILKRDKATGLIMAIMLCLSVSLSYATMGIGQYKNSLESVLSSGKTYDVIFYQFPNRGPVLFLLKAEDAEYPKYYWINMDDATREKTKKKLEKLEKQKLKLGHGQIQLKGKGTEDEDYGVVLDPNDYRPELQEKDE